MMISWTDRWIDVNTEFGQLEIHSEILSPKTCLLISLVIPMNNREN